MSDFENDLRNYIESSASPVNAEEVMGSDLVTHRVAPSTRRGVVVALATAAAVVAAVVGASYFINRAPDQVVPIGTTATTATTAEPDPTSNSTIPSTTEPESPSSTTPSSVAIPVSDLFDGEGARDALVSAFVVWDSASARLCDLLLESFPPQCGGLAVVIADPENIDTALFGETQLQAAQGVRWTPSPIEVEGRFDGNRFIVGGPQAVAAAEEELAIVDAFVALAGSPSADTASAVAFAPDVALGLGPDIVKTVSRDTLGDTATWILEAELFRAYVGPFSALDLVEEPYVITVGAHPHCASAPVPPPAGFETNRRVSIQPESPESCLMWWTVDFFVDPDGEIGAVTLDVYEP